MPGILQVLTLDEPSSLGCSLPQRSCGGLAIKLIRLSGCIWYPSIGSWLAICRTLSSSETWDHWRPMYSNVCVANSSEGNCANPHHILLRTPCLCEKEELGLYSEYKAPGAAQDTGSRFHKQPQEVQRTCPSSRSSFAPDTAALQSQFPKYKLFSHISVRLLLPGYPSHA